MQIPDYANVTHITAVVNDVLEPLRFVLMNVRTNCLWKATSKSSSPMFKRSSTFATAALLEAATCMHSYMSPIAWNGMLKKQHGRAKEE
jgi:hypothetical protein